MADSGDSFHKLDSKAVQLLKDIANKLRLHSISSTTASNSGWVFSQLSDINVPLTGHLHVSTVWRQLVFRMSDMLTRLRVYSQAILEAFTASDRHTIIAQAVVRIKLQHSAPPI